MSTTAAQSRSAAARTKQDGTTEQAGATDVPRVEVVKASFNLPRPELDALTRIAAIRGINATQALRQAISLLAFLTDLPQGSRVFVREPNGDQREVIFHNF